MDSTQKIAALTLLGITFAGLIAGMISDYQKVKSRNARLASVGVLQESSIWTILADVAEATPPFERTALMISLLGCVVGVFLVFYYF